ncbi:class IV adenylate cyclase [Streptosporangium sp. OZ121]|uniref:class IV adenylate cyclase n=1 Tax=unclassified Streptosporangium TaxID=2632669 RepID=UPI003F791DFF
MNMSLLEVEIRYQLAPEDESGIEHRLTDSGFEERTVERQVDTYFTSRHKDFIETEECLRIRQEGSRELITWKPPSTDEMKTADEFWKEEIDLDVTGNSDVAFRLLSRLDFVKYCVVDKTRRIFVNDLGVEAGLDQVAGVGVFLELEVKTSDVEEARTLLRSTAESLGLDPRMLVRVPYRDLVPRE